MDTPTITDLQIMTLADEAAAVLLSAGCPLATDEVYTRVLQDTLTSRETLAGMKMSEIERLLAKVAAQGEDGRWRPHRAADLDGRVTADEYAIVGASFEPIADGCAPKQVDTTPSGAVTGGRNTAFYNAHSYHTKVPPEAISPFIEHFTRPGDIVLDPFSGSGMTGVAAALLGRRCVLNDLAVIGPHLAYNHTRTCDPEALEATFSKVYAELLPRFRTWYRTLDEKGREGYVHYTIWSNVYTCKACSNRFTMWSVTDTESGRVGQALKCPKCGHSEARQSWRPDGNEPVFISYEVEGSSKRRERSADDADKAHIATFHVSDIKEWYPKTEIHPDREMYIRSALHLQGIKTVTDFYTPRNLQALAALWEAVNRVEDQRIRFALSFAFTNTAWHGTKMRRYNARGGQRPLTGTLYVPQLSSEANVLEVMSNKVAQLCAYYRSFRPARPETPPPLVMSGSATEMHRIPSASIDYIFTDPPFGSNIFYADCNLVWESWLGRVTDDTLEAVVNRSKRPAKGGKRVEDYTRLMTEAMCEMHRVLKPGGWVTLVFHNTDADVWAALQHAAAHAGFRIDGAAGLDRQQHSHKGYKGKSGTENVAHFDVVLSMQKAAPNTENQARPKVTTQVLSDTLVRAAKDDPRVGDSLQWAHSVVIRTLISAGFDLSDVSYERVQQAWSVLAPKNAGAATGKASRRRTAPGPLFERGGDPDLSP